MAKNQLSSFDLLTLPNLQRQIAAHLLRQGPASAEVLAQSLGLPLPDVRDALDELARQGAVLLTDESQARVSFGRTRCRTLPARLWHTLLATDRPYSAQEIAALRTSLPFLQFARARLGHFADHGSGHALRVKSFATQLGYLLGLTQTERHLLRVAALFHDVGNAVDRSRHNLISQQAVEDLAAAGELPFNAREAALIGLLCRWHRGDYDSERHDSLADEPIRTGVLASILRVADALDIDQRRFDYTQRLMHVLEFFYPQELPFWTSHKEILGVRIRAAPAIVLQVFVREEQQIEKNIQIVMLRKDLAGTPLDWSVELIPVKDERPVTAAVARAESPALLVFPFEPHSLVMAALSRQQLRAGGWDVELLCYPDTAGGSTWLWGEVLSGLLPECFGRLVVIGDRPEPAALLARQRTVEHWQQAGVPASLLNRHEANWSALHALRRSGAEIVLGGDWAYFWGRAISLSDLAWGRVAALCTRDPSLPLVGIQAEETTVAGGLLKVVYDATSQAPSDTAGWAALAEPILDRIAGDDADAGWTDCVDQASSFTATWGRVATPSRVVGRVLLFEDSLGVTLQSNYWVMEAAIEAQGRTLERGICFRTPYAIASQRVSDTAREVEDDAVELLAMNHWREEEAVPIRLLCPPDLDPPPAGHEGCVYLRLPARQARLVVQALIDACNQSPCSEP
jgi:hypothetical protein